MMMKDIMMMTMMAMVMVVVVFVAPFVPLDCPYYQLEWYRRCDVRNERHKASARGWHTLVRKGVKRKHESAFALLCFFSKMRAPALTAMGRCP